MIHIEAAGMSIEELRIAIERHMFEADLHMRTAEALLEAWAGDRAGSEDPWVGPVMPVVGP